MENPEEYKDMVRRLKKDPREILGSMSTGKMILLLQTAKLMIQAGTILDEVKRRVIYNKPPKPENIERLPKAQADIQRTLGELANAVRVYEEKEDLEAFDILKYGAEEFFEREDAEGMDLLHMAFGVAGEGCEMIEGLFPRVFEGGAFNPENALEEDGDCEFFLEGNRQIYGRSRAESLDHNTHKLEKGPKARYSEGEYSDEAAGARRDKENDGDS